MQNETGFGEFILPHQFGEDKVPSGVPLNSDLALIIS